MVRHPATPGADFPMKRILCILACIALLVGCAPTTDPLPAYSGDLSWETLDYTYANMVYRFIDAEAGVVCYYVDGGYDGGLSCLPCSQTNLDCGQ